MDASYVWNIRRTLSPWWSFVREVHSWIGWVGIVIRVSPRTKFCSSWGYVVFCCIEAPDIRFEAYALTGSSHSTSRPQGGEHPASWEGVQVVRFWIGVQLSRQLGVYTEIDILRTVSKLEASRHEEIFQKNTTMMYRPPEMCDIYQKYEVSEKVDIWMLGCILYTLCFYEHPF